MGYRKYRVCQLRNSNEFGDTPRRNYATADALEDAYNQGYNKGYCDGVKAGREQGYCEGYEQGLLKSCLNSKQEDWDYIVEIECC